MQYKEQILKLKERLDTPRDIWLWPDSLASVTGDRGLWYAATLSLESSSLSLTPSDRCLAVSSLKQNSPCLHLSFACAAARLPLRIKDLFRNFAVVVAHVEEEQWPNWVETRAHTVVLEKRSLRHWRHIWAQDEAMAVLHKAFKEDLEIPLSERNSATVTEEHVCGTQLMTTSMHWVEKYLGCLKWYIYREIFFF